MKNNNDFILLPQSMYMIQRFDEQGRPYSEVHEGENIYIVYRTPKEIIEQSLENHDSSFEAAVAISKAVLKKRTMLPVVISLTHQMIYFPTHAYGNSQCIWLCLAHIKTIEDIDRKQCVVHFINGAKLKINMNKRRVEEKRNWAVLLNSKEAEKVKEYIVTRSRNDSEKQKIAEKRADYRTKKHD